jgi:hypothetical protein
MFKNSNIDGDRLANSAPPSAPVLSIMPSRKDGNHGQPQLPNEIVSNPCNIDINPYTESYVSATLEFNLTKRNTKFSSLWTIQRPRTYIN